MKPVAIIGYSGHAFVAIDIFASNIPVKAYFEAKEKDYNPFQLTYKGIDSAEQIESIKEEMDFFIGIEIIPLEERYLKTLQHMKMLMQMLFMLQL